MIWKKHFSIVPSQFLSIWKLEKNAVTTNNCRIAVVAKVYGKGAVGKWGKLTWERRFRHNGSSYREREKGNNPDPSEKGKQTLSNPLSSLHKDVSGARNVCQLRVHLSTSTSTPNIILSVKLLKTLHLYVIPIRKILLNFRQLQEFIFILANRTLITNSKDYK